MIFQLSDWFPKPMIWAIIVKFDQIRKNWWRISCAESLEVGKNFFAASSVKKMSRFEEVSPEKITRIAWKFTKTVVLLGLAGYELIITNSAVIYISSYPARPRRITVNYRLRCKARICTYAIYDSLNTIYMHLELPKIIMIHGNDTLLRAVWSIKKACII